MPTRGDGLEALIDSSAAVALLVEGHEQHEAVMRAVGDRRVGLCGHAVFEMYSVLTRLPAPHRRSPALVARLIADNFPHNHHLSPAGAEKLILAVAQAGLSGGSVYDALVAATAREHELPLLTADRRATAAYRALDVRFELIGSSS